MASIRVLNGRYYARYKDASGRQKEVALKARTKTEARELARELELNASNERLGLAVQVEPIKLGDLVREKYLPLIEARKCNTISGRHGYATTLGRWQKHLLPEFGEKYLHEIRPADIDLFLARKSKELKPETCEKLRTALAALFTFAKKKLKAFKGDNPALLAEKPRIVREPPKHLEANQVERFLAAAPVYWRSYFAVAIYAGLRKGELAALRVQDVDLDRGTITVVGSYDSQTKDNDARVIPIAGVLLSYLKDALAGTNTKWLFPDRKGNQRNINERSGDVFRDTLIKAGLIAYYRHACQPAKSLNTSEPRWCGHEIRLATPGQQRCERCGNVMHAYPVPIPLTLKDLRATFGTLLYEGSNDIRLVQALLGHSDPSTTIAHYALLQSAFGSAPLQRAGKDPT